MLGRLLSKLSDCDMKYRADHADTKQPYAHVMNLFFETVDHRLRRVKRVNRLSSLTPALEGTGKARQQPVSVESRPGRLLLVRNWCQALALSTSRMAWRCRQVSDR